MKEKNCYAAFGKMPFASEFVKVHLNHPLFIDLELWYRHAFRYFTCKYGEASKQYIKQMSSYHFLYANRRQKLPTMGSVFAGVDTHARYYPFVMGLILSDHLAHQFLTSVPLISQDFFLASEKMMPEYQRDRSLQEFTREIDQLMLGQAKINNREGLAKVIQELKSHEINVCCHRELLSSMIIYLRALFLYQQIPANVLLPIKLPQNEVFPYVVFFLHLIDSVFKLSEFDWQAFWSMSQSRQPYLFFSFEPISDKCWDKIIVPQNYQVFSQIPLKDDESLYDAVPKLVTQIRNGNH